MNLVLVVLNYNDYKTTCDFIEKHKDFECIDKFIIVDNRSPNESLDVLKKYANPRIDVIQNTLNNGYSGGNNFGCKYAIEKYNPRYIGIANPDVVLNRQCILSILSAFSVLPEPAIISASVLNARGEQSVSYWKRPAFCDCLREKFHLISYISRKKYSPQTLDKFEAKIVDVVPGSFFIIDASIFEKIGFFDEDTFLYYEENILSFKLKQLNYCNYVLGNETYVHNHSVSINKSIKSTSKKFRILHRSSMVYCKKYLKINCLQKCLLQIAYVIGSISFFFYSLVRRN